MRELKFRAWDLDNKKYEYDIAIRPINRIIGVEIFNNEMYPVEFRGVVEQYTGLKDKNGKEIYEGDRIKIEGSDTIYTVEYGRGVWVARFGDESGDNICLYHYVQKDIVLYTEVIGNIHENRDLLEEEE